MMNIQIFGTLSPIELEYIYSNGIKIVEMISYSDELYIFLEGDQSSLDKYLNKFQDDYLGEFNGEGSLIDHYNSSFKEYHDLI